MILTDEDCSNIPRQLDSDSGICFDHDVQNPPDIFPQSPCMSVLRRHPTINTTHHAASATDCTLTQLGTVNFKTAQCDCK